MAEKFSLISKSPAFTRSVGIVLGQLLRGGDIVCLSGELGAGKTWLTSGIAAGWGALEPVHSPTFVFIHRHQHASNPKKQLYHVDCYRLTSAADVASLGLEDLLYGDDVVVLEWPERIADVLPPQRLWIDIDADQTDPETSRQLSFAPTGPRYEAIVREMRVKLA